MAVGHESVSVRQGKSHAADGLREGGGRGGQVQPDEPRALDAERGALVQRHPTALQDLVAVFGGALAEAYDQLNSLASDDVMQRVLKTLRSLAEKLGEAQGDLVEIATYLTQDELAQMVKARRERVSTALNVLRQRGIVQYSQRGRLRVDMRALTE